MKNVWRAVKNEWNEYNDGEILVRELTKNDSYSPNPEHLQRLNELTKDSYSSPSIYVMLNKRLHDLSYLLHVEKSLIVIEYLLKHSDTRFIRFMKMQTDYIKRLRNLKYLVAVNEFEKVDKAQIVRRRAQRIYALLTDDEELEKQRCKAQGKEYVPKSKAPQDSNKSKKDNSSNDNKKQQQQQQQQQVKQNTSSDKKHKNDQQPSSDNKQSKSQTQTQTQTQSQTQNQNPPDLFSDFIDVQNTSTNNNVPDNQDDLFSEDWLTEFANMPNSGTGQDGTALFSFENNDDFGLDDNPFGNDDNNKSNKNNDIDQKQEQKEDPEDWLTQLTNLDNILQTPAQDKKAKSQGKTLAQMAQESGTQSMDTIFSTPSQPQDTFNPYTSFISNQNAVQPSINNVFISPQIFNQSQSQSQSQSQPQPQQANNLNFTNKNDPFDIFSNVNNNNQPIRATYPSNNQTKDPFADLGKLK